MAFNAYFSKETVKGAINPALLTEQAAAVFDKRFVNCDGWPGNLDTRGMGIYLEGEITKEDEAAWDALIVAHDGTQKTAEQLEKETAESDKIALIAKVAALPDDDVSKMLARQIGLIK